MRRLSATALALGSLLMGAADARADDFATNAESLGRAMAYILPLGCASFATVVNGLYLSVDEGAPARWRTTSYVCGAAAIGVGIYVAYDTRYENASASFVATIPMVVGAAAIGTALWVGAPRDLIGEQAAISPWFVSGGGGLSWAGTF